MVQDLLPILPQTIGTMLLVVCLIALAAGLVLWLAGAVWSRAIVTLLAVFVGGSAGMLLPRWYIWPVNSMSIAVLGAIVLGVLAFVLPRLFAGITLGVFLAAWATLGTWIGLRGDAPFDPPAAWQIKQMIPPECARDLYQRLPDQVQRVIPYAAGGAMLSALAIALLWPRIGRTLMASTIGVTLMFLGGLFVVVTRKPDWLHYVPQQSGLQPAILGGLIVLGALIQWQFLPVRREVVPKEHQSQGEENR